MIEEIAKDYAEYMKPGSTNEFNLVEDVIDGMLTRLEELDSVIQIVKEKNRECYTTVSDDVTQYRSEVTTLSKKISTISNVVVKLRNHVQQIEQLVEKAETNYGINNSNKLKSLLKPFMKNKPEVEAPNSPESSDKPEFSSVMDNFDVKDTNTTDED